MYTKRCPVFSSKNLYGFIKIYIFAELYLYFHKNSECLLNNTKYLELKQKNIQNDYNKKEFYQDSDIFNP